VDDAGLAVPTRELIVVVDEVKLARAVALLAHHRGAVALCHADVHAGAAAGLTLLVELDSLHFAPPIILRSTA